MASSILKRAEIPALLFGITGLIIWFSYFTGVGTEIATSLTTWPTTLANFSIVIGFVSFIRLHGTQVAKQTKRWPFSALTLVCFLITFVSALISKDTFDYIINNIYIVTNTAMLSFVGFYNLTLFYRIKLRTWWVGLLVIITIMFLMWTVPLGLVYLGKPFVSLSDWIYNFPNNGGMKGLTIAVAIGMISIFIRGAIGYEKSPYGGE
jgi:hypothetical protein